MTETSLLTDRRGVLLMLLSVVLFAANTLLIRGVAASFPMADGWLASLFRGVCGLAFVVLLYGSGRGLDLRRLIGSRLVIARGVIGAIGIISFYITVTKLGASRAVVLNLTYPAFATVIAAFWLKERVSRAAMAWMAVGFGGLVLFLSGEGNPLQPSPYDLLGLFGAFAAGWVIVVIRRLRHEEHPATIYASQAFYGLIASVPAVTKLPSLPPFAWGGLAVAALIVAWAQLLMTRAFQALPVSRGSAMQMLLPLVTATGGFFFLKESFNAAELGGAALTVFATWRVVASR